MDNGKTEISINLQVNTLKKPKELEKIADRLLEKAAEMTSLANELYRLIGHVNNG
ncbi:hypothetical protein [Enterococcus faecium]|uniref:hypothetical protein n=1 Tax=Enterococcus faecium TaxID=1352 RepID=UPI0023A98BD7|nr:hypothetical protein [Enterococcus faecium]MDE5175155.1 hypothetical protein [Enterococcus faecium]